MKPRTDILLAGRLARLAGHADLTAQARGVCLLRQHWPRHSSRQRIHELFVFAFLGDLPAQRERVSRPVDGQRRFVLFQDHTPIESVAELLCELDVRTPSRLHVARLEFDDEHTFLRRFLAGLRQNADGGPIMDAWWDGDEFVVISPGFERLRVPAERLPKLRRAPQRDRRRFILDPEGAYVHWPSHDVHLGWAQFQQIVDPQALLRARQKSERFNQRYGRAIRTLREQHGLTQSAIAGLDPRTVRRIEKGETRATSTALARLAAAHGLEPNAYLDELARRLPA